MRGVGLLAAVVAILSIAAPTASATAPPTDLAVTQADDLGYGNAAVGTSHNQRAFVRNNGPATTTPVVTITASAGQTLTTQSSGCASNSTKTILTCTLPITPVSGSWGVSWTTTYVKAGAKTVTVRVAGSGSDPISSNNSKIIKTPAASADLSTSAPTDDTGGSAVVGTTHQQHTTVSNGGPDSATRVVVTITASAGQRLSAPVSGTHSCASNTAKTILTCTFPSIYGGQTYGLSWSTTYTTAGAKTVTMKIDGPDADPVTANNTDVLKTPAASADLFVALPTDLTDGAAVVGSSHDQYVYANTNGPDDARNVVLTVTASAGQQLTLRAGGTGAAASCTSNAAKSVLTCAIAQLDDGDIVPIAWTSTYTTAGAKTVTMKIDGPDADPVTANNTDVLKTPAGSSDLQVVASDATDTEATVGGTHQQSAALRTTGPDASGPITFTVTASAGQTLTAAAASPCTRNAAKTVLTCKRSSMFPGLTYYYHWTASYQTTGVKTVTVKATGTTADPVTRNNTSIIKTPAGTSDLSVGQITDLNTRERYTGDVRSESASIRNLGPDGSPASTVYITTGSGQDLTPVSSNCTTNAAKTVLTCSLASVASGASRTVSWRTTYRTAGTASVNVTVDGPNADPDPNNNVATLTSTVLAP